MTSRLFLLCTMLVACGGSNGPIVSNGDAAAPDAASSDAGPVGTDDFATHDATTVPDIGAGNITPCTTTGDGGIVAAGPCFTFTAAQAGAASSGVNATVDEYALEPAATAQNYLVVQLNASLGTPAGAIVDPTKNLYNAIAAQGFHVIGLAYRSNDIIGSVCATATCYSATRKTVVLGAAQPGAASAVTDIRTDEGIVQRLDAALRTLAAARPNGGWSQYLADTNDPDVTKHIAWTKITSSGHSQGGGHAAYLGLLFPLHRVVQLSSTCDEIGGTPVAWTDASDSWMSNPATSFVGFAAPTTFDKAGKPLSGDTTCGYHHAVWVNMAMNPLLMHDDAATCGNTGDTHSESLICTDNFPAWGPLYVE